MTGTVVIGAGCEAAYDPDPDPVRERPVRVESVEARLTTPAPTRLPAYAPPPVNPTVVKPQPKPPQLAPTQVPDKIECGPCGRG